VKNVAVVGAGLAGSECAWILAEVYDCSVTLFEMKSKNPTPAQDSPHLFSELVCSNSLKSVSVLNPAGSLKNELLAMSSLIVTKAFENRVPAGESLSVDRIAFSSAVTQAIKMHSKIRVIEDIVSSIDELQNDFDKIVIATGPLTHDSLAQSLRSLTGTEDLYFYDAIAPIVDGDSVDMDVAFWANRQTRTSAFDADEGAAPAEGDYLNLPLNKEQYTDFVQAVLAGDKVPFHSFEEPRYFNGCQPIESLAESGPQTLSFGPMKGRGLTDPKTNRWPFAAVQLRQESKHTNAFSMVGFQTRLTWTAQKNILRLIPGLQNADFHRFGSMHRNTYLVSPSLLAEDFSLRQNSKVHLAGQIMGVEGYLESAAMGNLVGHVVGKQLQNQIADNVSKIAQEASKFELPPADTSLGCLARYVLFSPAKTFSPMNIHWGLFSELSESQIEELWNEGELGLRQPLRKKLDKSTKRWLLSARSKKLFECWKTGWESNKSANE
jgi:methylenetetrahydrofolate--tRNA-(uracil-5-)-methyltransferase